MFQVVMRREGYRYDTVAEFPTYREARRACRRALFKYWGGVVSGLPEVTRLDRGMFESLGQPTLLNYGRVTCNEEGYQESFTPCEAIR